MDINPEIYAIRLYENGQELSPNFGFEGPGDSWNDLEDMKKALFVAVAIKMMREFHGNGEAI